MARMRHKPGKKCKGAPLFLFETQPMSSPSNWVRQDQKKQKKKQGAEQYLLSSNFLWNFLEDNLKKSARVSTIGPLSSSVWVWIWSAARGPALLKSQNKGGLLLKSKKADAHTFSYPLPSTHWHACFSCDWRVLVRFAVKFASIWCLIVLSVWLNRQCCVRVSVVFNCLTWSHSLQMEMLLVLDGGGLFYVFALLNGFNVQQIAAGWL